MKTLLAFALALTVLFSIACAEGLTDECMVVVTQITLVRAELWEIVATTQEGQELAFYADGGETSLWHIGDLVVLDLYRPSDAWEDAEVLDATYLGTLSAVGVARWLNW